MTDTITRYTVAEMLQGTYFPPPSEPVLGSGTPAPPLGKEGHVHGMGTPLTYFGGPRDGDVTPASADMLEFEHEDVVYTYRKGLTPQGKVAYIYESYKMELL